MNRFDGFLRWAWSILVACTLAFTLVGCDGDDGAVGPAGPTGGTGPAGPPGPPGPVPDAVTAAINAAEPESCGTCHAGIGDGHQAIYDKYVDASNLQLLFTQGDVTTADNGNGTLSIDVDFRILQNGMPYIDAAGLPGMDQKRFIFMQYFPATQTYGPNTCYLSGFVPTVNAGEYTASGAACEFTAPATDWHIYGYLAEGALFTHEGASSELPAGSHVHLYDNVASAAVAFGAADAAVAGSYDSTANVAGCEKCHGQPYLKHGYRAAEVDPLPDFGACKSCHYDTRNGGHPDWQYMVDEPFNWATGVPATADYSYLATVMNDTHMSHAMEFPYPMSMSNCASCHEGKLDRILTDENFTVETCKSCHAVQGIDAWPGEAYAQGNRAPPLEYLWEESGFGDIHDIGLNCQTCHSDPNPPGTGVAARFNEMHSGYDATIYNDAGEKYADLYTVQIDQVTMSGNLLTVNFSSNDPTVTPEVLVSLYGWDTKNFIVASHTSDGSTSCLDRRGNPGGCRMEYVPESSGGSANPLWTEDAASVPGTWMVTLDLGAYVPTTFLPEDIPTQIANGSIKKAEVTITPELAIGDTDLVLRAVDKTFDIGGSMIVDNYFKGANATVSTEKCNVCHDALASSFHDGSGRGGEGIEICKNCHVTTSPGSHLEMASRAIDSYVHAIHSFQPFDLDEIADADDPVLDARYEQHILHTFPNFTIRNCEACHLDGTYNVPDQAKSMPGVLSESWDIADRNIGTLPEYVTGPASRACGGCHRADLINADLAGDLATLNAHTKAFGTLEENDAEDLVLYGIIDKIMSMFE
jgi:OmcA/MtrC family decaheme c-type cytochrome